jgi:hypothetical protein
MGELFEVFSDPRPGGVSSLREGKELGKGFRKFLKDRGEYPFRDDVGKGRSGAIRLFNLRSETLLVVALAFLITNIASFSMGVWNGKRGVAEAQNPSQEGEEPVAAKIQDVIPPKVFTDPVPVARPKARPVPVAPAKASIPSAGPASTAVKKPYTIRVASLSLHQTKEAREIANFFATRGYKPTSVRKAGSKNLVIEVGAFSSCKSPDALRALRDVKQARYKFTRFQDAFFVRK